MTTAVDDPRRATRFLRAVRAVRRFSRRPIPEDVLADILEVARWTGSSKNSQPWELVVVRERATLSTALDAGRLAQNLMLAAWAHGIGSCIASLYPDENERRAKALLRVPDDRWLRTLVSLGYPADAAALRVSGGPAAVRAAVPTGRRPLAEIVRWERYSRS